MKVLLHDIFTSWQLWVSICCAILVVTALVLSGFYVQRADYQSRLDSARVQAIDAIEKKMDHLGQLIESLRVQQQKSSEERKDLRKTVNELKQEVNTGWH